MDETSVRQFFCADNNTEFVYAPYITDTDSLPDDVTIDNDYIIKKDRSLKELSLTATDYKMFSGGPRLCLWIFSGI